MNIANLRRLLLSKRLALLCGCVFVSIVCAFFWLNAESPFAQDPNLVKTTPPTTSFVLPGQSLVNQLFWKYYELKRKLRPNPLSYTFPANGGPSPCSIHGLLNQCMEVGGTQYFIEKNVAGGSVNFGSTNVLNGAQWIAAFEDALQAGKAEWWDSERKAFRKENLVILRYGGKIRLVLSAETANRYQNRYSRLKRIRLE